MYYVGSIPVIESDLRHYGITGMKWGVRRYQNEDRSLTPEGRIRYGVGNGNEKGNEKPGQNDNGKQESNGKKKKKGGEGGDPREKIANSTRSVVENTRQVADQLSRRRPNQKEKEKVKSMSDDELRRKINRMQMEEQYYRMTDATKRRGMAKASEILQTAGSIVGIATGVIGIVVGINQLRDGRVPAPAPSDNNKK